MIKQFLKFGKNSTPLKRGAVFSIFIKIGSALFAFVNSLILARILTLEEYGYYALAYSVALVLAIPSNLGLPSLITRYSSKYLVSGNDNSLKGLLIRSNQFVLLSSLTILLVAYATHQWWWNPIEVEARWSILLSLFLFPILGFGGVRSAFLRGHKLVVMAELPETLLRNASVFFVIVIAYFTLDKITSWHAVLFQIIGAAIAFSYGHMVLWIRVVRPLLTVKPVFHTRAWFKQAIPFMISSGTQVFKVRFLSFVIAGFGTVQMVALFEIALRVANLVAFTLDGINRVISPYISTAYEKMDKLGMQRMLRKSSLLVCATSLPIALVFIAGGPSLLELMFGEAYRDAYWAVVFIIIGQLVSVLTGSVGVALIMTDNQKVVSATMVVVTLINLVISIPLVLYFGINGVAFGYGTLLVLQNLILLFHVRKRLEINPTIFG